MNWFECKVKYQNVDENNKAKNVTEAYLVDAASFTEAESRIYKELQDIMEVEFNVTSIKKAKIAEIFPFDDIDTWYKCKVAYVDVDEKSGKEKKVNNDMYITAENVKQACDRIEESLKSMAVPFEITSVVLTPIVDVFPYNPEDDVLRTELKEGMVPKSELEEVEE